MSYTEFFEFKEHPFRITPDVEFFFSASDHMEALQSLKYFADSDEGFLTLTGEPGTGKTITIRKFMNEMPENIEYAYVMFPNMEPEEMFRAVLEDFGFTIGANLTKNALYSGFREFLIEKKNQGKKAILIIDEAQNLPDRTLEELRILSNLETEKEKLIRFVIAGQPELDAKLNSPSLRQLRQRISLHINLDYMSLSDMSKYVAFRLAKGGFHGQYPDDGFLKKLYSYTGGNPRLVNLAMERALMAAYVDQSKILKTHHLNSAAASLRLSAPTAQNKQKYVLYAGFALLFAVFIAGAAFYYGSLYAKSHTDSVKPQKQTAQPLPVKKAPSVPKIPEPEPEGTVKANILNLRTAPDTESPVLAKLKHGDTVSIINENAEGWLNIRYTQGENLISGWVFGRNIIRN